VENKSKTVLYVNQDSLASKSKLKYSEDIDVEKKEKEIYAKRLFMSDIFFSFLVEASKHDLDAYVFNEYNNHEFYSDFPGIRIQIKNEWHYLNINSEKYEIDIIRNIFLDLQLQKEEDNRRHVLKLAATQKLKMHLSKEEIIALGY
jgi:hypothetical protein